MSVNEDRTSRQKECLRRWVKSKGIGTVVACTGFGKTRVGLLVADTLLKKYPSFTVIVVVPTELLQRQWIEQLDLWGMSLNSSVHVINSIVKENIKCDLLILDEIHRYSSILFREVFDKVSYKAVLGLTATFERLDGLHKVAEKYCPVIDTITLSEALVKGWVSKYTEYKVIINTDLSVYNELNAEFQEHFAFFNYDFNLAMSMLGKNGYKYRIKYRDFLYNGKDPNKKSDTLKLILIHCTGLMRTMQARKKFIYECPDKVRLAKLIMDYRSDKKIITFSATTKVAESIGNGYVYTGKTSKKKSRTTIEYFNSLAFGTLHTVKKANEGMDIKGLSVAINLCTDSSTITAIQRKGRVIRKESDKIAEIFTFILAGTVEEKWWQNSHQNSNYITIDEEGLLKVLEGKPFKQVNTPISNFMFRY